MNQTINVKKYYIFLLCNTFEEVFVIYTMFSPFYTLLQHQTFHDVNAQFMLTHDVPIC